jgi:hypothetical protein
MKRGGIEHYKEKIHETKKLFLLRHKHSQKQAGRQMGKPASR